MSFKETLRALFKLSGGQAMPSDSETNYEYTSGNNQSFVAPSDGYLSIGSSMDSNDWSRCVMWGGIETVNADNGNSAAFSPMKKGQTKHFNVTSVRFVKFISTVGGGG